MSEAVEIQMARLQEQLKSVIHTLAEDREDRKERDKQITKIVVTTDNLDRRLEIVEKQLASSAPTIEEFMLIKQRAIGAGLLGKYAWLLAGVTITALYACREAIKNFFLH